MWENLLVIHKVGSEILEQVEVGGEKRLRGIKYWWPADRYNVIFERGYFKSNAKILYTFYDIDDKTSRV